LLLSNFISYLFLVLQGLHNPFEILYAVKNCSQEFRGTGLPFTPLFFLWFGCCQGGKTLETHLLRPLGSELLLLLLLSLMVTFSCNQGCQIHFLFQQLILKGFHFWSVNWYLYHLVLLLVNSVWHWCCYLQSFLSGFLCNIFHHV
jgi:hypothetical protein